MASRRGGLSACGGFLIGGARWLPPLPAARPDAWWSWLAADPQQAVTLLAGLAGLAHRGLAVVVAALTLLAASARRSGRCARRAVEALTPRFARGSELLGCVLGAAVAGVGGRAAPVAGCASPSLAPVPAPVVAAPELPPLLDLDRPGAAARLEAAVAPACRRHAGVLPATAASRPPRRHALGPRRRASSRGQLAGRHHPGLAALVRGEPAEIGADPGLLLVGEVLVVPAGVVTRRRAPAGAERRLADRWQRSPCARTPRRGTLAPDGPALTSARAPTVAGRSSAARPRCSSRGPARGALRHGGRRASCAAGPARPAAVRPRAAGTATPDRAAPAAATRAGDRAVARESPRPARSPKISSAAAFASWRCGWSCAASSGSSPGCRPADGELACDVGSGAGAPRRIAVAALVLAARAARAGIVAAGLAARRVDHPVAEIGAALDETTAPSPSTVGAV